MRAFFFPLFIFSILVLHLHAPSCPKFTYMDLSELKLYPEIRLGQIKNFMRRNTSNLILMSRVIKVFDLLFKGHITNATRLFKKCPPPVKEAQMIGCFFKNVVECLRKEYKNEPSYYGTWADPCNPNERNVTVISKPVTWKPEHLTELDNETISILFNLAACARLKENFMRTCPQPCATGLLCLEEEKKVRVRSLRCWSVKTKWYRLVQQIKDTRYNYKEVVFNYSCDCFSHLQWNYKTFTCQDIGQVCDRFSKSPCNEENTVVCESKLRKTTAGKESLGYEVVCTCKEGFYGTFCEFRSNACTQAIVTLKMKQKKESLRNVTRVVDIDSIRAYTGNELCNVNMSGDSVDTNDHSLCFPELGTRSYQCRCVFPFQEDLALGTPNCIIKRTACDRHLCLHGTCMQSPDEMSEAVCLCDSEWEGDYCDTPADHWSPWTDCTPMCGIDRKRFRWRDVLARGEGSTHRRIMLSESCSDRVDYDCPGRNHSLKRRSPYLTGKLKFVEQILLSLCVSFSTFCLLFFIYINVRVHFARSASDEVQNESDLQNQRNV